MKAETMTSRERVMAVFEGKKPDRTPVITPTSVASVDSMDAIGVFFPDVHNDAQKMANLAAAGHDIAGFDSVAPYFSVVAEAAAMGAEIDWGAKSTMPSEKKFPVDSPYGFVIPEDYLERGPVKTIIDSIRILKEKYGDTVAIIGKVMGPWTLSYNLYGTQNFLMDTVLEPEKARAFLDAFGEMSIRFALAQVEAGADIITWADHATGNLIGPKGYEEFLFPVQKKLVQDFRKRCPRYVPLILHTCGMTLDRVELFAQVGFDAFHFDSVNTPEKMAEKIGDKIILTGCMNNPEILLQGKPEDVRRETKRILKAGIPLISPECAIPCKVPNANLRMMVETVREVELAE